MKIALALVLALTSTAAACPDGGIDARLAHDARAARWWDRGWAAGFGVAAIAQGVAAELRFNPFGTFDDAARDGLWVGAGKATIGALGHLVIPLRIVRDGDLCHALVESGHHERTAFWINQLGNLLVNAGGTLLLGTVFHSWKEGLISLAEGYPIGLVSVYTMPRGAWHAAATLVRSPDYTGVAIVGRF